MSRMKKMLISGLLLGALMYGCSDNKAESFDKKADIIPFQILTRDTAITLSYENAEPIRLSWERARTQGGTVGVFYEVQFADEKKDFQDPVMILNPGSLGYAIFIDIKQAEIDSIARKIGIQSGGTGNIYWRIKATTGVSEYISSAYKMAVTRPVEGINNVFISRAKQLMTSLIKLYLGKSARDCWNNYYPNATGPYWNGDATVWGQGAGFSGYVAIREVSAGISGIGEEYGNMTDRMFNSINRFITTDNNMQAYAVYPANGNDRYYDDNVWIGLDMIDLYSQTKEQRFLDKAIMVWNYLMTGYDDACGGGVYWREIPVLKTGKNTCSSAPAAVLGCKLYNMTGDKAYLNRAIELYEWLSKYLRDPEDDLYWDSIHPDMSVVKNKYSYNSGQPMQAACLIYKITGDEKYLADAQRIAKSAYKKWFMAFHSDALGEDFNILKPDHVWFQSILLRGLIELYRIDGNREYVTAYEKTLSNAWLTDCRNKETNLLNSDFRGINAQTQWDILHEGAIVEMLSKLGMLVKDGL